MKKKLLALITAVMSVVFMFFLRLVTAVTKPRTGAARIRIPIRSNGHITKQSIGTPARARTVTR